MRRSVDENTRQPSGITPLEMVCAIATVRARTLRSNETELDQGDAALDEFCRSCDLEVFAVEGLDVEYALLLNTPTLHHAYKTATF
jgi:hypothetical protein